MSQTVRYETMFPAFTPMTKTVKTNAQLEHTLKLIPQIAAETLDQTRELAPTLRGKNITETCQNTDEEFDHIHKSCEAGRPEAEIYLTMADEELKITLERNIRVFCVAGMSTPCPVRESDHFRIDGRPVREYLQTRYRAIGSFLGKLSKARGDAIKGITPLEYEHLVTSLQATSREYEVYCTLCHERIVGAFAKLKEITDRLGVGFENPYSGRSGDYFEFFFGTG